MYYNYHARAQRLIEEGHLIKYEIKEEYNGIAPALVLYFDNHIPMPIREHKWEKYFEIINRLKK